MTRRCQSACGSRTDASGEETCEGIYTQNLELQLSSLALDFGAFSPFSFISFWWNPEGRNPKSTSPAAGCTHTLCTVLVRPLLSSHLCASPLPMPVHCISANHWLGVCTGPLVVSGVHHSKAQSIMASPKCVSSPVAHLHILYTPSHEGMSLQFLRTSGHEYREGGVVVCSGRLVDCLLKLQLAQNMSIANVYPPAQVCLASRALTCSSILRPRRKCWELSKVTVEHLNSDYKYFHCDIQTRIVFSLSCHLICMLYVPAT